MPPVRPGMMVSVAVHTVVLTWGLISFGNAVPNNAPPVPALPVELITPEEFDQIAKGDTKAKEVSKPKQKAEKVEPIKQEPKPEAKIAKQDVKPAAAEPPKQVEAPKPEPKPEPAPAKAESTPPAPKPEPPRTAEPKAAPDPAPAPDKPKTAEAPRVPTPPKRPEPPKEMAKAEPKAAEKPKKPETTFSPDRIAALIDKRAPSRTERSGDEVSSTASVGASTGTAPRLALSQQRMIDAAIREQVQACWNPPIGAAGANDLRVTVRFALNPDGTLSGSPAVTNRTANPFFQAAADSALRAVYRCSPLNLPQQAYDYWKEIEVAFDPREMLGG